MPYRFFRSGQAISATEINAPCEYGRDDKAPCAHRGANGRNGEGQPRARSKHMRIASCLEHQNRPVEDPRNLLI